MNLNAALIIGNSVSQVEQSVFNHSSRAQNDVRSRSGHKVCHSVAFRWPNYVISLVEVNVKRSQIHISHTHNAHNHTPSRMIRPTLTDHPVISYNLINNKMNNSYGDQ